jgi:hypothetical protein
MGYAGYRYRAEHSAAKTIERVGGSVLWKERGPSWLTRLLGKDPFAHVQTVTFVDVQVRDEDLSCTQQMFALEEIYISQNRTFTGTGLQHLNGLDELRIVYLYDVPVTDDGLKTLPNLPNLRELYVLASCISDVGIRHLEQFRMAKVVQLGSDRLTKEAVGKLGEKLPRAQVSWSGQGFAQ